MKEEIKDDLTYKIIGCAMKVHSTLGNGFQEIIYQRALAIEFRKANLSFVSEREIDISELESRENEGRNKAIESRNC